MKLLKKKNEKKTELERVEERREEVLATGRKFKYPLQWTKYRVVMNSILIILVMGAVIAVAGWIMLYQVKDTSELLYRVTRVVPLAVADVDGEKVNFSDYLMLYRSSMASIERQSSVELNNQEERESLEAQYKRAALDKAEEYAYAMKLGKEQGASVTEEEITKEFERHRQVGGVDRSKEGFLKIIKDNFGLGEEEYRRMLYLSLMKAKVEMAIDELAKETAEKVEELIAAKGGDYQAVASELGEKISYEETGGLVSAKNIDGGRAVEAMKLEVGGQSGRFVSMNGDGYYFVKLVAKTEAEVNFISIKVPFLEFGERFGRLKEAGKIKEKITL